MYDLLIKGARVIDPSQNIDDYLDLAIIGSKIAKVDKNIDTQEGEKLVEANGKIVTPGLIDLHCHVYNVMSSCVAPDDAGLHQAVTTVVDGGSAGQAIFDGFPRYVIPSSRTTVYCFLNLSSIGLSVMPELRSWNDIDADATTAVIDSNRDIIKGIKLRLADGLVVDIGTKVLEAAQGIAKRTNLPVLMHIGDASKRVPATLTADCLSMLQPGDIVSHIYTALHGGVLKSDGKVLPELKKARDKGIVLDVAQGMFSLSFRVARKCMEQGVLPTTISTDLTSKSIRGPVYGLTASMSRFIALGLTLGQVIEMTTVNPARAIGIESSKGSLKPGTDADISILELLSGVWEFQDSEHNAIRSERLISPYLTVKSGRVIEVKPVAQPNEVS